MSSVYDLYSRGCALLEKGHPHAACLSLTQARDAEPEKVSIRVALGQAFFNSGQITEAAEEFHAAAALAPADDYSHFGLGLSYSRLGKLTMAARHLKLAIAMRPDLDAYRQALSRVETRRRAR